MFKKLKEKITEEVKSSPQRFQQLTQSVSDKLGGGSTSDDNFFSIGEDDANISNTSNDHGFSSVNLVSPSSENRMRRTSTSSMASDVSFLPRYEAGSFYHLQSDLDASASEVEDNVSQSSSQLGHLSKEQIYSAFQKSQMRYHKYRGRYSDLARHYKELERENAKMKSVLVETQDKAIRRVGELKEQCSLEQKAKAHLESALRDELDEKEMKIQSLQTKIDLVKDKHASENLLEKESDYKLDSEQLTKYLNDARSEIEALNIKIHEFKASSIVFQSKEQDYKMKIASLEKDIASFSEREKENNIKLAENKMELHNELLGKDAEISRLKQDMESLRMSLNNHEKDNKSTKIENLQSQNNKLIDRVENLTQKCNGLENELLKVEKYKIEIQELNDKITDFERENKEFKDKSKELIEEKDQLQRVIGSLKDGLSVCQENLKKLTEEKENLINTIETEKHEYEKQMTTLRDSAKKGLFTLEKQILERVKKTYEERESNLKEEFQRKLIELSSNDKSLQEMHLQLVEKDEAIKYYTEQLSDAHDKLAKENARFKELESYHLGLIEESDKLRSDIANLEKKLTEGSEENSKINEEKIARLQEHIKTLQGELEQLKEIDDNKEDDNVHLAQEMSKLQSGYDGLERQVRLEEERVESAEMEITGDKLQEMKVKALEDEKTALLESFENERKMFNEILMEHKELKVKELQIHELEARNRKFEEKVTRLKGYLNDKEESIVELNKKKLELEQELSKLQESLRLFEERQENLELDKNECSMLQLKLQQFEKEKRELLESFEKEREMFDQSFHKSTEEFDKHKEEIMKENVDLAKENLKFKELIEELSEKVRIIEEQKQAVELDSIECNMLKLKLQELEKEKGELVQSFDMEREMFNNIIIEHKELKLQEEHMKGIEKNNQHLIEKVAQLKDYLHKKEEEIVELNKAKLNLEQEICKLQETIKINREQLENLEMDKTECSLLEMKLKALENEKQSLTNSFEEERKTFEKACHKAAHAENRIEELSNENLSLKEEKDALNCQLKEGHEKHSKSIANLEEAVRDLQKENETLKIELVERENKIKELTTALEKIRNDLENQEQRCQQIKEILDAEKNEKQNSLEQLKEVRRQLEHKNAEINDIRLSLSKVEALYNESKDIQTNDVRKFEILEKEKQDLKQEKHQLEKDLRKKSDELNFKSKEMSVIEQQFALLSQDKESLVQESRAFKERVEQLTEECGSLQSLVPKAKELDQIKKQNESLQNECDRLNHEISELKVRINQLSSDNKNINEEHDRLLAEVEEHKVKNEFLENEKGNFDGIKLKLEEERDSLQATVANLTENLQQTQRDLETLTKSPPTTSNNLDLAQIQKDFLEIKEKCDELFTENKNLKVEYTKLEEQCSNFGKSKKDLENQISELEWRYNEALHEKQLLQDEIVELKISPINVTGTVNGASKLDEMEIVRKEKAFADNAGLNNSESSRLQREIETLRDKVTQYKSLDLTNKSSIEFYENELQKLQNKNEKLNRKLDETLVTLNHCTELSSSTEVEYLRNVLFNYMLGKESLVLARVIAAVCKFDPSQTEAVLQKEQQKQTLLGQLGLL